MLTGFLTLGSASPCIKRGVLDSQLLRSFWGFICLCGGLMLARGHMKIQFKSIDVPASFVLGSTVTVFLQLLKCLTLPFLKETSLCSRDKVLCPHRVQGWACWSASSRTPEGSRTSSLSLWLIFLPLLSFFSLLFSPFLFSSPPKAKPSVLGPHGLLVGKKNQRT